MQLGTVWPDEPAVRILVTLTGGLEQLALVGRRSSASGSRPALRLGRHHFDLMSMSVRSIPILESIGRSDRRRDRRLRNAGLAVLRRLAQPLAHSPRKR